MLIRLHTYIHTYIYVTTRRIQRVALHLKEQHSASRLAKEAAAKTSLARQDKVLAGKEAVPKRAAAVDFASPASTAAPATPTSRGGVKVCFGCVLWGVGFGV